MTAVQFILTLLALLGSSAGGKFKFGDRVPDSVASVHPYYCPGEKYRYDELPWPCRPEHTEKTGGVIHMDGTRPRKSLYSLHFRRPVENKKLCDAKTLTKDEIGDFAKAIKRHYEYEMIVDDLSVLYQVGYYRKPHTGDPNAKAYLFTHREFHVLYNKDRIISVNITKNVGVPVSMTKDA